MSSFNASYHDAIVALLSPATAVPVSQVACQLPDEILDNTDVGVVPFAEQWNRTALEQWMGAADAPLPTTFSVDRGARPAKIRLGTKKETKQLLCHSAGVATFAELLTQRQDHWRHRKHTAATQALLDIAEAKAEQEQAEKEQPVPVEVVAHIPAPPPVSESSSFAIPPLPDAPVAPIAKLPDRVAQQLKPAPPPTEPGAKKLEKLRRRQEEEEQQRQFKIRTSCAEAVTTFPVPVFAAAGYWAKNQTNQGEGTSPEQQDSEVSWRDVVLFLDMVRTISDWVAVTGPSQREFAWSHVAAAASMIEEGTFDASALPPPGVEGQGTGQGDVATSEVLSNMLGEFMGRHHVICLLPPYAKHASPDTVAALGAFEVPEHDTLRLARHLDCTVFVDVQSLRRGPVGRSLLTTDPLRIILSNPLFFEYLPPGAPVPECHPETVTSSGIPTNSDAAEPPLAAEDSADADATPTQESAWNLSSNEAPTFEHALSWIPAPIVDAAAVFERSAGASGVPSVATACPSLDDDAPHHHDTTAIVREETVSKNVRVAELDEATGKMMSFVRTVDEVERTETVPDLGAVRFILPALELNNAIGGVPGEWDRLTEPQLFQLHKHFKQKKTGARDVAATEALREFLLEVGLDEKFLSSGIAKMKWKIKSNRAILKRRFPSGHPFLDRRVLAQYFFDILPPDGSVEVARFRELHLPQVGRWVAPITSMWLNSFPHLFVATQNGKNEWLLTRSDHAEAAGVTQRTPDSLTDEEVLTSILQAAPQPLDPTRATSTSSLTTNLSEVVRKRLKKGNMREFMSKYPEHFRLHPESEDLFYWMSLSDTMNEE